MKRTIPAFIFSAILVAGLLAGCNKEGVAIEETSETMLYFRAITVDTLRAGVKVDGDVVFNDFLVPSADTRQTLVKYYDNHKHIVIYNVADNSVLFDSLFALDKSTLNITLYQRGSGQPLSYVAPPTNEAPAPDGYGKISFSYTFPALPGEVKVVVQNSLTGGTAYGGTDSFLLKRGDFSPFFRGRIDALRRAEIYLYSTDAARTLLGRIERGQLTTMNTGFTIYTAGRTTGQSNGVFFLGLDKLY